MVSYPAGQAIRALVSMEHASSPARRSAVVFVFSESDTSATGFWPFNRLLTLPMNDPLLIEFDYDATVRPCDLGQGSTDTRSLALYFKRVVVAFAGHTAGIVEFDLAGQFPQGFCPLFGFSAPEPSGVWSSARSSCFLLDHPEFLDAECVVTIICDILIPPQMGASVRVNGHSLGRICFDQKGSLSLTIPAQCRRRALIAAASNNVSLSAAANPAVTVIVPNYNRWDLTASCVIYLLRSQTCVPYEIIIVDNCSAPSQYAALQDCDLPVQIVRLDERRSFGEANNLAVESARGAKLLFLNNDAFVRAGCIDRLAQALEQSGAGAAGPVFEDSDGRLQEAGCFIDIDGTVLLRDYRHFQSQVDLPLVSEVHHISAACLMLKCDMFVALGGFDFAYDPAYHEDADLCCKLRATGKRVLLVRDARTLHIRNATVNTLPSSDPVFAAPSRSHAVFASRWGAWLMTQDPGRAPMKPSIHMDDWRRDAEPFRGKAVHALLFAGELQRNFDSYATMAVSAATSRLGPTLFCTRTSYSMLRYLNLADEFSLPATQIATANERSLPRRNVQSFIYSSCEMPPEPQRYGERQILHCSVPEQRHALTEQETRKRIDALSRYEAIVTESELAKQNIVAALRGLGAPSTPIFVIPPPVPEAENTPSKEDLIVSVGPFRNGAKGGGHDRVLRGFQRWRDSSTHDRWHLVCVGEVESADDISYFHDFRFRAAAWQVTCVLAPTSRERKELYRRAKVCLCAGAADNLASENQTRLDSSLEVGDALAYGCVPVVYARGIEAELCKYVGVELVYDHPEEINERIALAVAYADSGGYRAAFKPRASAGSSERFYEQWAKLLRSDVR